MDGGPPHTRYNRSKSGWFDASIFQDWFEQMFLPYIKKRKLNQDGKVVLIGDNLSSHFCPEVFKLCEENSIVFVCLPKNSTHLTQPLDVAFFRPLKTYWRAILDHWKTRKQKTSQTVTKESFPRLLNTLYSNITKENVKAGQLVSGFKKSGIVPFNPVAVISRIPGNTAAVDTVSLVSESVLDMLKELRNGEPAQKKQRRTKLNIEPGKSIAYEDLQNITETSVNRNLKVKDIQSDLRKMVKGKNRAKAQTLVCESDESENTLISKNMKSNGVLRRKRRILIVSDSENEEGFVSSKQSNHNGDECMSSIKKKTK